MADKTNICNRMLSAVGTRSSISSITEGSNESNEIALIYDSTRDEILSMAMWNFARRQITLTQIGSSLDQTALPPWAYEYAYPSDCVHARYVLPFINTMSAGSVPIFSANQQAATSAYWDSPPVPFIVGNDDDAQGNQIPIILTNQYQAQLVYTGRIVSENLFSAAFTEAFVAAGAARLAIPLCGDKELKKSLFAEANEYIKQARVSDGNEGLTIQEHLPDWLAIRGYAMDFASPGYYLAPYPPLYPIS